MKIIIFKKENKLLYDETLQKERSKKWDSQWTELYEIIEKLFDVNYKITPNQVCTCNRIKTFIEQ